MVMKKSPDLQEMIASAQSLGLQIDEAKARQWLNEIGNAGETEEISVDMERGVFGLRKVMLDFSPKELSRLRKLGDLIAIKDRPGQVESALAISGSAAQSRIQSYPGDADFFQRLNIRADTKQEACQVFAGLLHQKALETLSGQGYQLIDIKFSAYPEDAVIEGKTYPAGSPIDWKPANIQAGSIEAHRPDGAPLNITWQSLEEQPGWCMMDWVIADPLRGKLVNVSNMFDVTWETPDKSIIPLDGYLDPYFQEVYLHAESIPVFSKLIRHVSLEAPAEYVAQLEGEVRKYLKADHRNYGKVAKRMYNIFRLKGRYIEAALLREMFDEPAGVLYQIWSLIRTIEEALAPGSAIPLANVHDQADELIVNAFLALKDAAADSPERQVISRLVRLRELLNRQHPGQALTGAAGETSAELIELVNQYFRQRLAALPGIRDYMLEMGGEANWM